MKQLKDLKLKSISDLVALNKEQLKKELTVSMKNLFVLKMKKEKGELKQTHLITFLRKYIAKVKTIANMKVD
jgi:large subunit ribosomal protein L29